MTRKGQRRRDRSDQGRPDKKKSEENMEKTRCPHCSSGQLKPKGASDAAGGLSWKCRSCGRRVWKRTPPKSPPIPLVVVSTTGLGG